MVSTGSVVRLNCDVSANPSANIQWFKVDQHHSNSEQMDQLLPRKSSPIFIVNAGNFENLEIYACLASNELGSVRKTFSINTWSQPKLIDVSDESVQINVGQDIELRCEASGHPPPEFTWYKDRQEITSETDEIRDQFNNKIISDDNMKLKINSIQIADGGSYECKAKNLGGETSKSFNVEIFSKPIIAKDMPMNLTVIEGQSFTLPCRIISGHPQPKIYWNGDEFSGSTLKIPVVTKSHSTIYTCTAENAAGFVNHAMFLSVHQAPKFSKNVEKAVTSIELTSGSTMTLKCPASGRPLPFISWKRVTGSSIDVNKLIMGPTGDTLELSDISIHDTGEYKCTVSNIAGFIDKSFVVKINMAPIILSVPDDYKNQVLREGETLMLNCLYDPLVTPVPTIVWTKNDKDLTQTKLITDSRTIFHEYENGQKLIIENAHVEDSGEYSCEVINKAGTDVLIYSINVKIPPQISPYPVDKTNSILIDGEDAIFRCDVTAGDPEPEIRWYINDELFEINTPYIELLPVVLEEHTGVLTCVAESEAGLVEHDFYVDVHIPPFIDPVLESNVQITAGRNFKVECLGEGYPDPDIFWLKDGKYFGTDLNFENIKYEDKGTYVCMARSSAGMDENRMVIDVLVPPSFGQSDKNVFNTLESAQKIIRLVNDSLSFNCQVTQAYPIPTIKWYRSGVLVQANKNLHFDSSKENLQVYDVQTSHAGIWECQVENVAGSTSKYFNIDVLTEPVIVEENFVETVTVDVGDDLTVSCEISSGNPAPVRFWRLRENSISSNNTVNFHPDSVGYQDSKFELGEFGESLTIRGIEVSDSGKLICSAVNDAGYTKKVFNLKVTSVPRITNEFIPHQVKKVGKHFELSCEVTGQPTPSVSWIFQRTIPLTNVAHTRISTSPKHRLLIPVVDANDAGIYTCIVENEGGKVEASTNLEIISKPVINSLQPVYSVIENQDLTLVCESHGLPPPEIKWIHPDGKIINQPVLHIPAILRATHNGIYTCEAANTAGITVFPTKIEINQPPEILPEPNPFKNGSLTVNIDQAVFLYCSIVKSFPDSDVYWHSVGGNSASQYKTINKTVLNIEKVKIQHEGEYTCLAKNSAGVASFTWKLNVIDVPKIGGLKDEYVLSLGEKLVVRPWVDGIPVPEVSWFHVNTGVFMKSGKSEYSSLEFDKIEKENEGDYIIAASNHAGKTEQRINIVVLIPPKINIYIKQRDFYSGNDDIRIVWKINSYPSSEIEILKNNDIFGTNNERVSLISTSEGMVTLEILKSAPVDSGKYVLIARNSAGSDRVTFELEIKTQPVVEKGPADIEIVPGEKILLNCEVSGFPTPQIKWSFYSPKPDAEQQIIPYSFYKTTSLSTSKLILDHDYYGDGSYTCIAENDSGKASKSGKVIVIRPPMIKMIGENFSLSIPEFRRKLDESVTLECPITSNQLPVFVWSRSNELIVETDRVDIFENGTLLIKNIEKTDEGDWTCVASNRAGRQSFTSFIDVRTGPKVDIIRKVGYGDETSDGQIVTQGGSVRLECIVSGDPEPDVKWSFNGGEILLNRVMIRKSPHVLRINHAGLQHHGEYTCSAMNIIGQDFTNYKLTVKINGEWSQWTSWTVCSATCSKGAQTRTRTCTEPAPQNGGQNCENPTSTIETKDCLIMECPIHGYWSDWSNWYPCSVTCGSGGAQYRQRICNNPRPQFGGNKCEGMDSDKQPCSNDLVPNCPLDGALGPWTEWSQCTKTCGGGTQRRVKNCDNPRPQFGGKVCAELPLQTRQCSVFQCPVNGGFSGWTVWSRCSTSCGGGQRTRVRICDNPYPAFNGTNCSDEDVQQENCNTKNCPVDGKFSDWSSWTDCSATCGKGKRVKTRKCNSPRPSHGGRFCVGKTKERETCKNASCKNGKTKSKKRYYLTDWSEWSDCTATCGGGRMKRIRKCKHVVTGIYSSYRCKSKLSDNKDCNEIKCAMFPEFAVGEFTGIINGIEIGPSPMFINISLTEEKSTLIAKIKEIPPAVGHSMQPLLDILSTVTFATAAEIYSSKNGYSLFHGNFDQVSSVEFATGESATIRQKLEKVDSKILKLKVNVAGSIPYSTKTVKLHDFTSNFVQLEGNTIYGKSSRIYKLKKKPVRPYIWNYSIKYDDNFDGMPAAQQMLSVSDIVTHYDEMANELSYHLSYYLEPVEACPEGFRAILDGNSCADIDECLVEGKQCSHGCINTLGSFECSCNHGYQISSDSSFNCEDLNECALKTHDCHGTTPNCLNTEGGFKCEAKCLKGFEVDSTGLKCKDVDECERGVDGCSQVCVNLHGSFKCACNNGYELVSERFCEDVDECTDLENSCQPDQRCENRVGSFECINDCPIGYYLTDNEDCLDVNECLTNPCGKDQQCLNSGGSYSCECPAGFTKSETDAKNCVDVNECELNQPCQHQCVNSLGSFSCRCPAGYTLSDDKTSCNDINECKQEYIDCGPNKMCFNRRGDYTCVNTPCPYGFTQEGVSSKCIRRPGGNSAVIELVYKTVALPYGVGKNVDLLKLIAKRLRTNKIHQDTKFRIKSQNQHKKQIPFTIRRAKDGSGILYTTEALTKSETYNVKVQARSLKSNGKIEYKTTFIIFISVADYPY